MSKVSVRRASEAIFDKYIDSVRDSLTGDQLINMLTIDQIENILTQYLSILDQQNKSPDLDIDAFVNNVLNNKTDSFNTMLQKTIRYASVVAQNAPDAEMPTPPRQPKQWSTLSNKPAIAPTRWHHIPRTWSTAPTSYNPIECPMHTVDVSRRLEENPNTSGKLWQKLQAMSQIPY